MSGTKEGAAKTKANRKAPPSGRPTSLNPEIQQRLIANRSMGLPWQRCARLSGISFNSVKNWQERGREALKKSVSRRDAFDNKCIDFLAACEKAEDEWIRRCEAVLQLSMTPAQTEGHWKEASSDDKDRATKVAMFKLTHQAPEDYNTRQNIGISAPDGGPIDVRADGLDVWERLKKVKESEDVDE